MIKIIKVIKTIKDEQYDQNYQVYQDEQGNQVDQGDQDNQYDGRPSKCLNHHNQRLCIIFFAGVNLLLQTYSVLL